LNSKERGSISNELVGVARVTVFAADLAPAIRIDGPLERHVGLGSVQDAAGRNLKILDGAFGFEQLAVGG
jgi:hypothetical protein